MTDILDDRFAQALRSELVRLPATSPPRRLRSGRRAWFIGGATIALVAGAGTAVALITGVPGGETVTAVGADAVAQGPGDTVLSLGPLPDGATGISFDVECLTPASITIGEGGTSVRFGQREFDDGPSRSSGELPLSEAPAGLLPVTIRGDGDCALSARFIHAEPVPLATNAHGETYGIDGYGAEPDLIAAWATNGREGYIRATDLAEAQGPMPTSPAEALALQEARTSSVVTIPVYESDGATRIGEFEVQVG